MKALVTGGGGFLGAAIVRRLLARGDSVRTFSRGKYPEIEVLGVEHLRGDLADAEAVSRAAAGCDIVYHAGARAGVAGPYKSYYAANVLGTENVIEACRKHRIRRLVYTSSPSVTFAGQDQSGIDETCPIAKRFLAHYPATKAIAEQHVAAANDAALATVSLRPHLIWGPGDNHLIPRLIASARIGRLRFVGAGKNLVDSVYVDNAADAHLLAADRLTPGSAVAGKVYYITNDEPLPIGDLINKILSAAGLPPVTKMISPRFAYNVGFLMETAHALLRLKGEPPMTRFVARQFATAHWFDISAAKRDLGYRPAITIDEGIKRLRQWFRESAF